MTKMLLIIDLQENFIKYKKYNDNRVITNHDALKIYNYINTNLDFFEQYNKSLQIVDILDLPYGSNDYISENSKHNGIYISDDYKYNYGEGDEYENNYDIEYDVDIPYEKFIDNYIYKTYGFLRDMIDNGLEHDLIIKLGKFMYDNNLSDSRRINKKMFNEFKQSIDEKIYYDELIERYPIGLDYNLIDSINLELYNKNTEIDLIGGGRDECLLEFYLLLKILGYTNVNIIEHLTY